MIIDAHGHIGQILNFNMEPQLLLDSMEKYQIDFTLISNIEGCEVDHNQKPIHHDQQKSQSEINRKAITFAIQHPDKIGVLLWAKAATEQADGEFENFIKNYKDNIYGIKIHPYHAKVSFDSDEVQQYLKLADKYNLPVVTHTANDLESSPYKVYEMAKKYKSINFVMYHMGLGSDNSEAINLISMLPNLYGDVSWVKPENVIKAIHTCGYHKILFGTDNPINGIDTYNHEEFYKFYWTNAKERLGTKAYEHIMYKNAKKIFHINKV